MIICEEENALSIVELVEGMPEGLCVYRVIDRFPYIHFSIWNKKMIEITGYTRDEINEKGMFQTLLAGVKKSVEPFEAICEILGNNYGTGEEWEIIRKDGQKRWITLNPSTLKSEGGAVQNLILIRDITKQKKSDSKINTISCSFETLFDFSTFPVLLHGDGKIIYANLAAMNLLGANSAGELKGKSVLDIVRKDYHAVVEERINNINQGKNYNTLLVEKIVKLNGETIDVEVASAPVKIGEKIYLLVFGKDIAAQKSIESTLKKSEVLLRKITENTLDLIAITDTSGNLTYVTPSHKSVLGYEPEGILAGKFEGFVHPDDLDYVSSQYIKMITNKCQIEFEYRLRHAEGYYLWIDTAAKPLYNNGEFEGFILCSRDITKRKGTQNNLEKSQKKFRKLFNEITDSIFIFKYPEAGEMAHFIEANNAACRRLGYSREEFYNMTPYDIDPELNLDIWEGLINELTLKGNVTYKSSHRAKDGKVITVEVSSTILDLNGESVILSIARDITERINSERSLRESEERYRTLVELLPYAVIIRNDEKTLFANQKGLEYLGASSSEEVFNKYNNDLIDPHTDYAKAFIENVEHITNHGFLPLSEEKLIRVKDGKILDLESVATKIPYGGEEAVLLVCRDISERKEAEELQRKMEEKSRLLDQAVEYERLRTEFFANISHELRTPINVILSTLQLCNLKLGNISDQEGIEKLRRHIVVMKQNCYRLIRLINNLIDVTKIDSGYLHLNLSNYNIVSIIEDITLSVAEYIENKGISLVFDTDVEEKILACDPDKIERIILNLISNSIKFTEPGGNIEVTVSDKNEEIIISVSDTGIGIPEEKQKHIFERFVQVDKSLTRAREGSGIGLSLVKSLVEMHEGTISVQSEYGKGSEFIINLPVKILEQSEAVLNNNNYNMQGNIEKINVEFSDIYF